MGLPSSRQSYADCYDLFDRASSRQKGIRINVSDYGEAMRLRTRLHYARKLDRLSNKELYRETPDHYMYNASVYDKFIIRIKTDTEGGFWVYIESVEATAMTVESLDDDDIQT